MNADNEKEEVDVVLHAREGQIRCHYMEEVKRTIRKAKINNETRPSGKCGNYKSRGDLSEHDI